MIDRFEQLLHDLGNTLGTPLHVDQNHSCTVLVDEKIKLQLELQKSTGKLLIGSHVSVVDPGRFRENVLLEALKANDLPYPQIGILGYSSHNNQLALFDYLSLDDLNGQKLADYLSLFIARALEWRDAILSGNSSPLPQENTEGFKPFGMK